MTRMRMCALHRGFPSKGILSKAAVFVVAFKALAAAVLLALAMSATVGAGQEGIAGDGSDETRAGEFEYAGRYDQGGEAGAASTPRIAIRGRTEVKGAVIRLGDIADIVCPPGFESTASRLRGLEIGRSPFPGHERTLSLAVVRMRLRRAGFDLDDMMITGPATVVVAARHTLVTEDAISAAVRAYVVSRMPWALDEAEVDVLLDEDDRVLVPEGEVSFRVEALPSTEFIGSTSVKVTICVDGEAYCAFPVRMRIDVVKEVVVAARTIERYKTIEPADVRLEAMDLARVPEGVAFDPAAVIGMRAGHTITAGRVVVGSSLEPPPIVRKGDLVTIEAVLACVAVSSQGEALEDGCEGARIRVKNSTSGAIIRARVVSAGVVSAM